MEINKKGESMLNLVKGVFEGRQRSKAKGYWKGIQQPGLHGEIIFNSINEDYVPRLNKILEFGCSRGGNLKYFMDKLPGIQTIGIDINEAVMELQSLYPKYTGIVGDEGYLETIPDKGFDLAFTVSVLDHIPSKTVVEKVIFNLLRIARHVMLLEPFVEGLDGDVSGKIRNKCIKGFEKRNKAFAAFSYLWDYDGIMKKAGAKWCKFPMPLYNSSLGPFYHLFSSSEGFLKDGLELSKIRRVSYDGG